MRNILLSLAGGLTLTLTLAACATTVSAPADSGVSLHETLDRVKSELRAVRRVMDETPDDFVLSCDGSAAAGAITFTSISVSLGLTQTEGRSFRGGADMGTSLGLSLGTNVSRSESGGSQLTVSMQPGDIPIGSEADRVRQGGIAESVLAMMRELAAVDDTRPCLDFADANIQPAVLRLSFTVDRFREGSGGASLLLLQVGGAASSSRSETNTITLHMRVDGMTM